MQAIMQSARWASLTTPHYAIAVIKNYNLDTWRIAPVSQKTHPTLFTFAGATDGDTVLCAYINGQRVDAWNEGGRINFGTKPIGA
ncbi:MAG: hypothetical protein E6Q36_08890 [Chryseobacterium sp.]|nr:MAG: hypothetical protein E6Q36_08890 [Chryseobacterium sp.]